MDKDRYVPIAKMPKMLSFDDGVCISEAVKRDYQNNMIIMSGEMELYFLDLQEGKIIKVE